MLTVAVVFALFIALVYKLEAQGRNNEQKKQKEQELDDIHRAEMARDDIIADPAAAKRLRERFTRKLL